MSIFSAIGKVLKKAVKPALSIATGGISDKVLSIGKTLGIGTKKAKVVRPQVLQATVDKIGQSIPQTSKTKTYTDISDAPIVIRSKKKATKKRSPAKLKLVKTAKATKVTKAAKVKRAAPRGGIDLKKLSTMWAAQGKPGKWIDFVKANSNVRKAS